MIKKRALHPAEHSGEASEAPPFFSSWKNIYIALLSFLVFLIILFYVFMRVYS